MSCRSAPVWGEPVRLAARTIKVRATGIKCALGVVLLSLTHLGAGKADLRLVEAAKRADLAAVRALLKQGVDVATRSADGATALHWAAYRDARDMTEALLRAGAPVNAVNELGVTPLWVAASAGNDSVLSTLLDAGADPNIAPSTGGTPLMLAARMGRVGAVKQLLIHRADPNAKEAAQGQTALMWAAAQRQTEAVRALIEGGANVRARTRTTERHVLLCCQIFNGDPRGQAVVNHGGFTPLLFAVRENAVDAARLLLDAGADVNETAADGASALAVAALSSQTSVAELLIERGADLNAGAAGYTPLHGAVLRKDVRLVRTLIARGANLNTRVTKGTPSRRAGDPAVDKTLVGATPFMIAVRLGQPDFMRALASAGANVNIGLADGRTTMMVAADGEQVPTPPTIIVVPGKPIDRAQERASLATVTVAAELGVDVNGANADGDTALHVAAAKRFQTVIEFLASRGARLESRNAKGVTPLAVALAPMPPLPGSFVTTEGAAPIDEGPQAAALLRKLGAAN